MSYDLARLAISITLHSLTNGRAVVQESNTSQLVGGFLTKVRAAAAFYGLGTL